MAKFKAEDCKNFDGRDLGVYGELLFTSICTTEHCVDRDNCSQEVVREIPVVHFERKFERKG